VFVVTAAMIVVDEDDHAGEGAWWVCRRQRCPQALERVQAGVREKMHLQLQRCLPHGIVDEAAKVLKIQIVPDGWVAQVVVSVEAPHKVHGIEPLHRRGYVPGDILGTDVAAMVAGGTLEAGGKEGNVGIVLQVLIGVPHALVVYQATFHLPPVPHVLRQGVQIDGIDVPVVYASDGRH